MSYGLASETVERINRVFAAHPEVEQAVLYGSRAMGTQKAGSDIDLTLKGDALNLPLLLKIENELDDLLLPYKIDLSIYRALDNPALVEHINRVGKVFYSKS